ncbi:polysaccharide export protein [Halomonas eurihalina]|uniref:Polysaccharide export protein n=1 Tax=Halomonas eurihalina TaxID=42566 RepID=A0A5D9D9J0_HALER|nr:polysaccharide biosynthesis/export family protein [Halomonas eurihalina]MDR5858473.1 polysaccharide biosynthesis/export family protein [Halomonas eurihalina]TZG40668.1 polysaccharide export protein [Halomonas eurihalina]
MINRDISTLSALLVAGLLLLPGSANAQSFLQSSTGLSGQQQSEEQSRQSQSQSAQSGGQSSNVDASPRANWQSANYGPVVKPNDYGMEANPPKAEMDKLDPFGANLFEGGFRGTMADGLNASYKIKPGDQVTLRAWGAVELDQTIPVDAQGNVYIPSIGPVQVQGMNSQQLDATVRSAIQEVFPQDVQVYTNLQGVQPVGVFVTGYVDSPGRYAGTPSDSVLYFLDQAGGIDKDLGSYRQIRVERDGRTVANVDLYDFLLDGDIQRPQFKDGDTIVVEERGPAIAVTGDVKREYRYELQGQQLSGGDVQQLARLNSGVSHVLLRGDRSDGPMAEYFPLDEFGSQTVQSGDEVLFSADKRAETIVVEIEGSFYGPSRYALPRNARLGELLDAVGVPEEMTSVHDISILREGVAKQQEEALEKSLQRLQTTYLGYPARTAEEGKIQVQQAELIERFVQKASKVEPTGQLVVARGNSGIADVRLQDGDVVKIPETNDAVLLSGEVTMPQAVVYTPGMSVEDYIEQAGGFTPRANDDEILVAHRNGAVIPADDARLRAGDEIIVLPRAPTSNLELAKSITQILYQVAVATKVALDL